MTETYPVFLIIARVASLRVFDLQISVRRFLTFDDELQIRLLHLNTLI